MIVKYLKKKKKTLFENHDKVYNVNYFLCWNQTIYSH